MSISYKNIVPFFLSIMLLTTLGLFQFVPALAEQDRVFDLIDVPEDYKYYIQIKELHARGIINGHEDKTFRPDEKINRVAALTIIIKAFNIKQVEETSMHFPDTSHTEWYSDSLRTAIANNIVSGFPDGSFGPNDSVTLVQALKMGLEAGNKQIPEVPAEISHVLADVHPADWYSGYVLYAKDNKILYISSNNEIDPNQELTRGKLADLIYRLLMHDEGYSFGIASYYGDMFHGRRTASGTTLDNEAPVAAHKSLPFGTVVEVMNVANGKSVVVTIVDRGPYIYGRLIDLTKGSFSEIAHPGSGIARIQFKIIGPETEEEEKEVVEEIQTPPELTEEMLRNAYPQKN